MEEMQPLEPQEHVEPSGDNSEETTEQENEESMDVPFGLLGANFLTNVLQYAVFLGLTMLVLIILRIFMPQMMPTP
jgi:hypothetical protein